MIAKNIFDLAVEALSPHNDGWLKKLFIKQLKGSKKTLRTEEKSFIERILILAKSR